MEKKSHKNLPEIITLGTLENGSDLRKLFWVFGFGARGLGKRTCTDSGFELLMGEELFTVLRERRTTSYIFL
jgi:hypothetical protein